MGRVLIQLGKSQISAAIATAIDYSLTAILFQFLHLGYTLSTLSGVAAGGLVNCSINYYWTFPQSGCPKRYIFLKYLLVWIGSMAFNTEGTVLLARFLEHYGMASGSLGTLMIAKITISIIVGLTWNFFAQKYFVYQNINIKHR